jgi:hypothetical protein
VRPLQRFFKVRLRDSKDRGCTVRLARPRALRTYLWRPVVPDALTALWRAKRKSLQMQINRLESRPTCALYERAMRKHIRFMYASRATPDYVRRLGFETHIAKKDISSTVYFATLGKCCEGHRRGLERNCDRLDLWGAGLPTLFQAPVEQTPAGHAMCDDAPEPCMMPARETRHFNSVG